MGCGFSDNAVAPCVNNDDNRVYRAPREKVADVNMQDPPRKLSQFYQNTRVADDKCVASHRLARTSLHRKKQPPVRVAIVNHRGYPSTAK